MSTTLPNTVRCRLGVTGAPKEPRDVVRLCDLQAAVSADSSAGTAPKYSETSSVNRLPGISRSWTVPQSGFANIGANVRTVDGMHAPVELTITVNGTVVALVGGLRSLRARRTIEVRIGDIVSLSVRVPDNSTYLTCDDIGCYFIPYAGSEPLVDMCSHTNGGSTFLLTADGAVYSCGDNNLGQLGRLVATGTEAATNLGRIEELPEITQILCTVHGSAYFLTTAGKVWSCGNNEFGQLGRVTPSGRPSAPNLGEIPGLEGIARIAGDSYSAYFIVDDGAVYSCGNNQCGQLGRAVATGSQTEGNLGKIVALDGVEIVQILGVAHSTYFLAAAGAVYSCGDNACGQLGRSVATGDETTTNIGKIPDLSTVTHVESDGYSAYFIDAAGTAWSCGDNAYGQLGRAAGSGSETTVNLDRIAELSDVAGVTCSSRDSAYFFTAAGAAYSCGNNAQGQLGRSTAPGSPGASNLGKVAGLAGVTQIAVDGRATYFLGNEGKVYSCGENSYGQLGAAKSEGSPSYANMSELPLQDVESVVTSTLQGGSIFFQTSALEIYSCGNNRFGQLGENKTSGEPTRSNLSGTVGGILLSRIRKGGDQNAEVVPSDLARYADPGTSTAAARADHVHTVPVTYARQDLEYGSLYPDTRGRSPTNEITHVIDLPPLPARHIYVSTASGALRWYAGSPGGSGQLLYAPPRAGRQPLKATQVATSGYSTFFLTPEGKVYSCGMNDRGACGRRNMPRARPERLNLGEVAGLPPVARIVPHGRTTFFLTTTGRVYSCGENYIGELGRELSDAPVAEIPDLRDVTRITATDYSVYFLTADKKVHSCGLNNYGQLGHEKPRGSRRSTNLAEVPLSGVDKVVTGHKNAFFILENGEVYSCGLNGHGQLGTTEVVEIDSGRTNLARVNVADAILDVYTSMSYDIWYNTVDTADPYVNTFFIGRSGAVHSCGENAYGSLGRNTDDSNNPEPVAIPGLANVTKIACANNSTMFLTAEGDVYGCGSNRYGHLLNASGTTGPANTNFCKLDGLSGIAAVLIYSSEYSDTPRSFFRTAGGEVYSQGYDNNSSYASSVDGSLGRPGGQEAVATKIPGLTDVRQLRVGNASFAVTSDGTVYSFGNNEYGQLGRGRGALPYIGEIETLPPVAQIVSSGDGTYFITDTGDVYSCGSNYYGQLGLESAPAVHTPRIIEV